MFKPPKSLSGLQGFTWLGGWNLHKCSKQGQETLHFQLHFRCVDRYASPRSIDRMCCLEYNDLAMHATIKETGLAGKAVACCSFLSSFACCRFLSIHKEWLRFNCGGHCIQGGVVRTLDPQNRSADGQGHIVHRRGLCKSLETHNKMNNNREVARR